MCLNYLTDASYKTLSATIQQSEQIMLPVNELFNQKHFVFIKKRMPPQVRPLLRHPSKYIVNRSVLLILKYFRVFL